MYLNFCSEKINSCECFYVISSESQLTTSWHLMFGGGGGGSKVFAYFASDTKNWKIVSLHGLEQYSTSVILISAFKRKSINKTRNNCDWKLFTWNICIISTITLELSSFHISWSHLSRKNPPTNFCVQPRSDWVLHLNAVFERHFALFLQNPSKNTVAPCLRSLRTNNSPNKGHSRTVNKLKTQDWKLCLNIYYIKFHQQYVVVTYQSCAPIYNSCKRCVVVTYRSIICISCKSTSPIRVNLVNWLRLGRSNYGANGYLFTLITVNL